MPNPVRVSLRPYPFPYKAALAITSDIDGCSPEAFRLIHEFLNTEETTPMGRGLGLPVGDSFWFYCNNPHARSPFTYFSGLDGRPGPCAPLIREGLRLGWIDSLHTYGDFDHAGGFRRELAQRALEELAALGARLSVWINHGNQYHGLQGVGHGRRLGDVPRLRDLNGTSWPVLEYHADLTVAAGFRFFWTGAEGQEITDTVGQERPLPLSEYYLRPRPGVPAARRGACLALGAAARALPSAGPFLRRGIAWMGMIPDHANGLLAPMTLGDGQVVYGFRRYGDYLRDGPEGIPELLSSSTLDRLEATGGTLSFFTHLGKPLTPRPLPFLPPETETFGDIARRFREGRLWVARTSTLLRHAMLKRSLSWHVEPSPEDLSNLGFVSSDPTRTEVWMDGRRLEGFPYLVTR